MQLICSIRLFRILATCSMAVLSSACDEPVPARPNIIFIMADDLGYGDLGSYGQEQIQTPHLDRLAEEGIRFTQFYAGSTVCEPSRAVLMTGRHTGHLAIRRNNTAGLALEVVTLAEILKEAGYTTSLIGKWGLGEKKNGLLPTRQGFDEFYGYLNHVHAHNYYPRFLIRGSEREYLENVMSRGPNARRGVAAKKVQYSHDLFIDEALDFIDREHGGPFFLFLSLTIPHANNEARGKGMEVPSLAPYEQEDWPEVEKGFAAMITRMDRDVGRIMQRLEKRGIDDDTIVMFTSDNGPHNSVGHWSWTFNSAGGLRGYKTKLYEGGIRVPLVARWPDRIAAGSQSDHLSHFADVMPTLAELADTEPPPETDGFSFVPTLLGELERQEEAPYLYWEFEAHSTSQALRQGHWKTLRPNLLRGPTLLYDLSSDPSERMNVSAEHPEVVARLEGLMEEAHTPRYQAVYWNRELAAGPHHIEPGWLARHRDELERNSRHLVEGLMLEPGQSVCRLGSAWAPEVPGISRRLGPTGRLLLASDREIELEELRKLAEEEDLTNVEFVHARPIELGLPESSCDLVLLSEYYHHLDYIPRNLWQIERALRPHGRVVVSELRGEDERIPIGAAHKMKRKQIFSEISRNRFRQVGRVDGFRWHHVLIFEPRAEGEGKGKGKTTLGRAKA